MANNADKQWWYNLERFWKDELTRNLLDSAKYRNRNLVLSDIYEIMDESEEILSDIVNLEKVHVSSNVICNFSQLDYLKKIEDFHFQLPDWKVVDAGFLDLYPEYLRSKVRRLDIDGLIFDDDLSPLFDFVNLEDLNCQCCQIESLEGIQKLTKLKIFNADQGNSYSDLNPLRGLNLVSLNMQFTKVTDISPLIDVPSLEKLDLGFLNIIDLSPLLKLPNLKVVNMPNNFEVPCNELEEYLYNHHDIDENNRQSQLISEQFDYDKTWYLIPICILDKFHEYNFLYEGRVLDNEIDFKDMDYNPISSIRIADSTNICRYLSEQIIYQVKIGKDTRLKRDKFSKTFWYASKVEILKSVPFGELLPLADLIFKGDICFEELKFIPEGLVLPKILNGDLKFWDCTLPKTILLPEIIEGSLKISYGIIPYEWAKILPSEVGNLQIGLTKLTKGTVLPKKVNGDIDFRKLTGFEEGVVMPVSYLSVTAETVDFPADFKLLKTKLKTLTFEKCKLPENFEISEADYIKMHFTEKTIPVGLKMPENYAGILTFEACEIPSCLKLSEMFEGQLVFKNISLPLNLELSNDFNGILVFRNVQIPAGFQLPINMKGTLKISDSKTEGRLQLPSNDGYEFELDKEANLADFVISDALLSQIKRLPSWHFEGDLSNEVLPF
jgi:hypothetical protein